MAWTTATVDWDNVGAWTEDGWYEGPDIKTIVQEIVDRDNWEANNALGIRMVDNGSDSEMANHKRTLQSADFSPAYAAKLSITYSVATQGTGTIAGASVVSGAMVGSYAGAGIVTGASATAGAGVMEYAGAGTIAGVSTTAGTPGVGRPGVGTAVGTSAVSGAGILSLAGAGTVAGISVAAGDGVLSLAGAGAVVGASSVSGAAIIDIHATGLIAGESVVSGSAIMGWGGSGTAAGVSEVSGAAIMDWAGAGTIAGEAVVSASAVMEYAGSGLITAISDVSGAGGLTAKFVYGLGTVVGTSVVSGAAILDIQATGLITGVSSFTASASMNFAGAGTIAAVSGVLGGLTYVGIIEITGGVSAPTITGVITSPTIAGAVSAPTITPGGIAVDYTEDSGPIVRGSRWPVAGGTTEVTLERSAAWPATVEAWDWEMLLSSSILGGTPDVTLTAVAVSEADDVVTLTFSATPTQTALVGAVGDGKVTAGVDIKSTDGDGVVSIYSDMHGTADVRDAVGEA